jgi:hypothetical protein
VVLPASGCEMMAKVRRLAVSAASCSMARLSTGQGRPNQPPPPRRLTQK